MGATQVISVSPPSFFFVVTGACWSCKGSSGRLLVSHPSSGRAVASRVTDNEGPPVCWRHAKARSRRPSSTPHRRGRLPHTTQTKGPPLPSVSFPPLPPSRLICPADRSALHSPQTEDASSVLHPRSWTSAICNPGFFFPFLLPPSPLTLVVGDSTCAVAMPCSMPEVPSRFVTARAAAAIATGQRK